MSSSGRRCYTNTLVYLPVEEQGSEYILKTYSLSDFRDEDFLISVEPLDSGVRKLDTERVNYVVFFTSDFKYLPIMHTRVLFDRVSLKTTIGRVVFEGKMVGCATQNPEKVGSVRTFRIDSVPEVSEYSLIDLEKKLSSISFSVAERRPRTEGKSRGGEPAKGGKGKEKKSSSQRTSDPSTSAAGPSSSTLPPPDPIMFFLNSLFKYAQKELKRIACTIPLDVHKDFATMPKCDRSK